MASRWRQRLHEQAQQSCRRPAPWAAPPPLPQREASARAASHPTGRRQRACWAVCSGAVNSIGCRTGLPPELGRPRPQVGEGDAAPRQVGGRGVERQPQSLQRHPHKFPTQAGGSAGEGAAASAAQAGYVTAQPRGSACRPPGGGHAPPAPRPPGRQCCPLSCLHTLRRGSGTQCGGLLPLLWAPSALGSLRLLKGRVRSGTETKIILAYGAGKAGASARTWASR